jgi:hypothetical protein
VHKETSRFQAHKGPSPVAMGEGRVRAGAAAKPGSTMATTYYPLSPVTVGEGCRQTMMLPD